MEWTDYAFESTFTIENRAARFLFRVQHAGNFYLWRIILGAEVSTAGPANAILRTHVFETMVSVGREERANDPGQTRGRSVISWPTLTPTATEPVYT